MSAFGLTYAVYVAIVGSSMVALDAAPPPDKVPVASKGTWSYSLGFNDNRKTTPGTSGIAHLDYLPAGAEVWRGLKPLYGFAVSADGAVYGSAGLRKDFFVGQMNITPHMSVLAFQADVGKPFEIKQLIQFKTGFDLSLPLTQRVSVGVGYYHISNAGLTNASAEMDVSRVLLQYRY